MSREVVWLRHPDAHRAILDWLSSLVSAMPPVESLAGELLAQTSSRLEDWLDHIILADSDEVRGRLADLGFRQEQVPTEPEDAAFHHPGALLPGVLLRQLPGETDGQVIGAAIRIEDISLFLMTFRSAAQLEGTALSPYRRAKVWAVHGIEFWVVERRGHGGFVPVDMPAEHGQRVLGAYEQWATRPRSFADELEGMRTTLDLARSLVAALGTGLAAWLAFQAERAYWQQRCCAGQVQKARQDRLALGWANHDHHTFRSSRAAFPMLIQILETLGFQARERFYAGAQAGWGAQVMEHPECRLAVFADVDLSPEEVDGDFAHRPLASRADLGTVGLWCALHGESMLGAGLHHLASRLDFERAIEDLAGLGTAMMQPFSDFTYLRQAFTQGERWPVAPDRLESLVSSGSISEQQRARFAEDRAIGSHLENIQRSEGFKGFSQHTISDIIRRTDPRQPA